MKHIEMPCIVRETSQGLERYTLLDAMFQRRKIQLTGEIDRELANSITMQLRYLEQLAHDKTITMYINSPGGSVTDGLAIYDTMQAVRCPIRTVCVGSAASMAAILFASGDQRDIMTHGEVMIHDPIMPSGGGSALEVERATKRLMKTRDTIAAILARHTGKSVKTILATTSTDAYFNAQEAVAFGLADQIISEI